jgi:hypothetical protein
MLVCDEVPFGPLKPVVPLLNEAEGAVITVFTCAKADVAIKQVAIKLYIIFMLFFF